MRAYTPDQLTEILAAHRLWVRGVGADLRGAYLGGAYLSGATLTGANLYGADLSRANLGGADLGGANLYGANLSGAYLGGADLGGANLYGANLSGAYLGGATLDEARGIVWATSGPCGIGPRRLLAVWTDGQVIVHAGCFRGSPDEMRAKVAAGGWNWPAARRDELAASVIRHLDRVVGDIHDWLAACGGAS